jgi:hypothetical protein
VIARVDPHSLRMHQISLLGLGDTARHPDGMHVLRPDRVYRTSVLAPMTGFEPGADVMMNARDFVVGPYTGMQLSGLRGPNILDKVRGWWQGVKARAAAGRAQVVAVVAPAAAQQASVPTATEKEVHMPGQSLPPMAQGHAWGLMRHGGNSAPSPVTAMYVGPLTRHLPQEMVVRAYGQSPSLPTYAEDAAAKTTMMMWRGLRWPWG